MGDGQMTLEGNVWFILFIDAQLQAAAAGGQPAGNNQGKKIVEIGLKRLQGNLVGLIGQVGGQRLQAQFAAEIEPAVFIEPESKFDLAEPVLYGCQLFKCQGGVVQFDGNRR